MKIQHIMTSLGAAVALTAGVTAGDLLASDASLRVYATGVPANPDRGDAVTVTFFADVTGGGTPSNIGSRIGLSYDFSVDFPGLTYVPGSLADASGGRFGQPDLGLSGNTLRAVGVINNGGLVSGYPAAGVPLFSAQFTVGSSLAAGAYAVAPRNNTLAESITMILIGSNFLDLDLSVLLDNDLVIGAQSPSTDDEYASNAVTFEAFSFSIVDGCNAADLAEGFGVLDINDILSFATAFGAGNAAADFFPAGGDGLFDINDILSFATIFGGGCPAEAIFEEDFEGLPRQNASSATEQPGTGVWGNVPPAGWTVDNSGVPANGVPEFTGWTFLDAAWWSSTAGNQNRGLFTRGLGVVAVADSDEWADGPSEGPGTFNTLMSTPQINIAGRAAGSLTLSFDSSWRPEDNQAAAVLVSYDGGPFTQIFSLNSGNTVDDGSNVDRAVEIELNNPAASTVRFRFDYTNGSNNWWWAIDNVKLLGQ